MPLSRRFTLTLAAVISSIGLLHAQKMFLVPGLRAEAQAGAIVSSNSETPFWVRTNQFGIYPNRAGSGIIQGTLQKRYVYFDSLANKQRKLDWSASVNPVITFNKTDKSKLFLAEAFASVRYRKVELYIGRRKELMGVGDSTLTSGFYAGSGNALPIPKIQIGTVGFAPLKFTKDFVAIHVGFSHGWFDADYIDGVRLHQKFLYLRFGKPKAPARVIIGLNHNALWAGHSDFLKGHPELAIDGKLPSSWRFYPNVVFAFTSKKWFEKSGYSAFDSYRVGNHLGSYDLGIEANLAGGKLFVYHQHPFEDVSSMIFKNIPDGLYGINYKFGLKRSNPPIAITHITAEYLSTKDQSGSTFYIVGSKYQGADNYFNHTQYSEGWSYHQRTVGTPFIMPRKDMDTSKPTSGRFFPNNKVDMFYLGLMGKAGKSINFTFRGSYSINYGTPGDDFVPARNQLSLLGSAEYRLPISQGLSIMASIATDQGEALTKRTGGYIGLRKRW